ncbi:MAG: domain S-box protein [Bacteroidetes bacterium]|jgi:PAS domain S-box-containing protein|nr:domain S-box protein [Bacteroidota bacterium]
MILKPGNSGTHHYAPIHTDAYRYKAASSWHAFSKTFDLLQEGIQIIDFNWRYLYVNNVIVSLEKTSREKLLGCSLLERHPGFKKTQAFSVFADCMYTRQNRQFETEFEYAGGSKQWVKISVEPIEEGILVVFSNSSASRETIVEEMRLPQEWEFDKNNLTALINNTTDLMWSVDRNYNLITSNEPLVELMELISGKRMEKGNNMLSFAFSTEQAERFKSYYERVFTGETVVEIEYVDAPVEGWSEISYCPIRNGNTIIGAACHARDITAIKKAEKKIKRSEKGLKESQAIAHLGNWEMDLSTGLAVWSDECCRIYGLTPDDNQKTYAEWISFIHPEDLDKVNEEVAKAQKNLSNISMTHRILLKDGTVKYISSKCKYELDANQKPVRLHGIAHDVTDRKLAEEEREKMVADMIQRSKKLEQFTYIISHNLRAPIANILGLSHVLKGSVSEEDRIKSQQFLFTAVEQLDETVKDLNKILQARAEITESKETVEFQELVNVVKSSIQNLIQKQNVQITTDFTEVGQTHTIKSYIHSIFYNLISNSIKYKQRGRTPIIEISSSVKNKKMQLVFSDNGIGIDLNQHGDKLFGLYKRFHTNVEGKGMGLFMVKTQIEVIGGSIHVESTPNAGTRFTIELPL